MEKISITLPRDLVGWLREQDLPQETIIEEALNQYKKERVLMTMSDEQIVALCSEICGDGAPVFAVVMSITCVTRYINILKHG